MPKVLFDSGAYNYSKGIAAIGLMYRTTVATLSQRRSDFSEQIREYRKYIAAGGEPIGKWDDGHRLWDQEDLLRLEQLVLDDAANELRIATVIAIYHHWEKSIPQHKKSRNGRDHAKLKFDANVSGIPLHVDIDALWCCANYFKHGKGKKGWLRQLLEGWGSRFETIYAPVEDTPTWVQELILSDANVEWFLEIGRASQCPISNLGPAE